MLGVLRNPKEKQLPTRVSNIRKKTGKVGGGEREDKLIKHLLREHIKYTVNFQQQNCNSFSCKYF